MKYRKKPVVIEAIQFEDTSECLSELSGLGLSPVRVDYNNPSNPVLKIETLEGTMVGNVGDFIIKGVSGEFYPCKPDIFGMTYEAIVDMENEEIPWVPKKGEFAYYPSFEQPAGYILTVWKNSRVDNRVKKAVGVYKTPDEALAKARALGWLE